MDTQNATLFGSVTLPVILNDGRAGSAIIRQIKIADYPQALLKFGNEIELLQLFCTVHADEEAGKVAPPPLTAKDLDGESYETVQAKFDALNAKGFFCYAARQSARAAEQFAKLPAAEQQKILSAAQSLIKPPPAA